MSQLWSPDRNRKREQGGAEERFAEGEIALHPSVVDKREKFLL